MNLLLTAVILVLIGWALERKVHELQVPRNQTTEAFLRSPSNTQLHKEMDDARGTFLHWHLASIAINLATILCVTGAMALAGNLACAPAISPMPYEDRDDQPTVKMPAKKSV